MLHEFVTSHVSQADNKFDRKLSEKKDREREKEKRSIEEEKNNERQL